MSHPRCHTMSIKISPCFPESFPGGLELPQWTPSFSPPTLDLAFFSFKKHTLCTPRQIPRLARTHMFSRAKLMDGSDEQFVRRKGDLHQIQDFHRPLPVTVKNLEVVCKNRGIEVTSSLSSVAVVYLGIFGNSVVDLFYPDSSPWGIRCFCRSRKTIMCRGKSWKSSLIPKQPL